MLTDAAGLIGEFFRTPSISLKEGLAKIEEAVWIDEVKGNKHEPVCPEGKYFPNETSLQIGIYKKRLL